MVVRRASLVDQPRSTNDERRSVVVVGGATVDVTARAAGPLEPGLSTPGHIRLSAGGAGRNVGENLARLGVAVKLLAAVDAHPLLDFVVTQTAASGVDTSSVVRVAGCGSYYAAIARAGRVEWAISDMAASEALTPGHLDASAGAFRTATAVVVDANLSPATIVRAVELSAGRPLCLLPVSVAKAARIQSVLPQAALVVLSAREAAALTGTAVEDEQAAWRAARALQTSDRVTVVVTMGEGGLIWSGAESFRVGPLSSRVVDPTGAGDAVAALAVYALLHALPPRQAARLAVAAAAITVGVEGATHPGLSLDALSAYAS